jgi:1,4-alpha-glucan branching enzyme
VAAKVPLPTAPTTPRTVNVSFALFKPDAKRVSLCGEFNGWSPDATPMRSHEGGHWKATLTLQPGRYQYKFVADGQWLHDPNAGESVPNQHGSLNSVVEVRL